MCGPTAAIAVPAAISAVGVIGGMISGSKAAKAQKEQSKLLARQVAIAEDQYARFKEIYGPAEYELAELVRQEGLPERYAEEAAGKVRAAFDRSKEIQRTELSRYGLEGAGPGSGAYESEKREFGIARAATEAEAKTKGRRRGEDVQLSRLESFVGLGKGIPGQTASTLGESAKGQGELAGTYAKAAGASFGVAAQYGLEAVNAAGRRPRPTAAAGAGSGYSLLTTPAAFDTPSS